MPERRSSSRTDSPDRRSFPRPPLWLNLLLLVVGIAGLFFARQHQRSIEERLVKSLSTGAAASGELNRIRAELASLDVSEDRLGQELDVRMKQVEVLQSDEFHLAIDTRQQKFYLMFGNDVVRDAPVTMGPPKTLQSSEGKRWTFAPIRGGFEVIGKEEGLDWRVQEWVYAMTGQPAPVERPVIDNGLGAFVIVLPDNYIIHSPPAEDSPLDGAKPASFMVPEADLRAIWPRVRKGMKVYIY